jgi:DNA-binding winged helix-turn-helix (wHTH) protein/Flp pilus assembly protein TadD
MSLIYEFDAVRVDCTNRECVRDGEPVPLTPLVFDALLFFIKNQGRLVYKSELLAGIWPDTSVGEPNLAVMISAIRKALGDNGNTQRYIKTVAKSGYRFIADVRTIETNREASAISLAQWIPAPEVGSAFGQKTALMLACVLMLSVGAVFLVGTASRHHVANSPAARPLAETEQAKTDRTSSAQAWYSKGRYSWSRGTDAGLKQSVVYFTNAINEDPRNASAYAGLSDAYRSMAIWSVQSSESAYAKAKQAAERAIALDGELSVAHSSLGMVAMYHDWDWPLAEREFRRAVELRPSDSLAHHRLGLFLAANNRLEEALQEMRTARDLDPLSLKAGLGTGIILYYARRYNEAATEFRKLIELEPHYSVAHYQLGLVYYVQQDFKGALAEFDETCRLVNRREPLSLALYAAAQAHVGNERAARDVLSQLQRRAEKEYVSPVSLAYIYLSLGQREQALSWIGKIFRDRLDTAVFAGIDPLFDSVRGDQRFADQLRRATPNAFPKISNLIRP